MLTYCQTPLELFAPLPPEKVQAIAFEIAVLGQNGLDINKRDMKYTLKELPSEFTGLKLAAYVRRVPANHSGNGCGGLISRENMKLLQRCAYLIRDARDDPACQDLQANRGRIFEFVVLKKQFLVQAANNVSPFWLRLSQTRSMKLLRRGWFATLCRTRHKARM